MIVVDVAWTIVAANPPAGAFPEGDPVGDAARRQFLGPGQVERGPGGAERQEPDLVGDLHRRRALHPDDPRVRAVVGELLAAAPRPSPGARGVRSAGA